MSALTLSVDNIHCEACARRVTNALLKAAPQAAVTVDVPTGRVTIGGVSAPRADLEAALKAAGYPVRP
jgi:copper chaperone